MPSSKFQPNQTRKNNKGPNNSKYRKLFNNAGLTNRTWKNYAKSFAPKWGNSEVGRVIKKNTGYFARNKINGPKNITTLPSNFISPDIITNARTTNHDLLRRLWRQFNGKENDIDFFPRIDTLYKIGKFEIELECYANKDKPAKTQAQRSSLIKRLTDKGVSQNDAAKVLCAYNSTSTLDDLKKRLNDLNLPVTSEIIEGAVNTLTLPNAVEIEKRKIITGLIILRLILSDQLIVRLKSNNSRVVETSFEELTTFGKILRAAAWITLVSSVIFEVPGMLIGEFPQEYMDYQNNMEIQIPAFNRFKQMTTNFLNQRYSNLETRTTSDYYDANTPGIGQTNADWLYTDMDKNDDKVALDKYIYMTKQYILTNNKLPSPEVDQALIEQINKNVPLSANFKLVPDTVTNSKSNKIKSGVTPMACYTYLAPMLGANKGWPWMTPGDGFYKLAKAMGFHGSIIGIKSVIVGATSWSALGGLVIIRKLHTLIKTHLNEKAKKDVCDFIDSFLFEFPVAFNLIKNTEYIKSFSSNTTLNLMIQWYIHEILKKDYDSKKSTIEKLYGTIFRENANKVNKGVSAIRRLKSATSAARAHAVGKAAAATVLSNPETYNEDDHNIEEGMALRSVAENNIQTQAAILDPNEIEPIKFANFNKRTTVKQPKRVVWNASVPPNNNTRVHKKY